MSHSRLNPPSSQRPWWLLPVGRVNPVWFLGVGLAVLLLDYFTGPNPNAPFVYFFPVALAAWYTGPKPALLLSVAMPVAHFFFVRTLAPQLGGTDVLILQTVLRTLLVGFLGFWLARLAEHERRMESRVRQLEGLLSICSHCKKIRNQRGDWESLELYISTRSQAEFTHALCESCFEEHYSDVADDTLEPQHN